jgi:chromosome partitioning protein
VPLGKVRDEYDFVIIDCSPSLGTGYGKCAHSVGLPWLFRCNANISPLKDLGKLLNTIKIVQQKLNTDLTIEGILLTMYDSRLRLSNQVVEEVKMHFQEMVFDTIIHRNTTLGEAPSFGQTILMHDASCKGSVNYLNLAREILQKNEMTKMS